MIGFPRFLQWLSCVAAFADANRLFSLAEAQGE
jgi:hypothetical protein